MNSVQQLVNCSCVVFDLMKSEYNAVWHYKIYHFVMFVKWQKYLYIWLSCRLDTKADKTWDSKTVILMMFLDVHKNQEYCICLWFGYLRNNFKKKELGCDHMIYISVVSYIYSWAEASSCVLTQRFNTWFMVWSIKRIGSD